MNQETQSIFDAKHINITPKMLQEIIIIQQVSLIILKSEVDQLEAQIDLGKELEYKLNLFPKLDKLLSEFEGTYDIEFYKVVSEIVNMEEIYTYLYDE